jgi:regulator of protease activity HflC (stomatin/prohibitin superfamily)
MERIRFNTDDENYTKKEKIAITKLIFYLGLGLMFIIAFFGWYIVPAGKSGILLTLGKVDAVPKDNGFHFKLPIIQSVVKMDIQTQKYEAKASSASKDLQIVSTSVAVNYHLIKDQVPQIFQEIGINYAEKIIQPAVQEVVKASTAQFTAEELITNRTQVKLKIDELLQNRLKTKGIIMETTSITNFDFSPEFNQAIESKVTAQQTALKAENDLIRIKVEKEQTITQAEAQAQSVKLKADADAYALSVIRSELEKSSNLIQYRAIEKWNGVLPIYSGNANLPLPIININST